MVNPACGKQKTTIHVYGVGLLPTSAYTSVEEFPFQYIEDDTCLQYEVFSPSFSLSHKIKIEPDTN